MAYLQNSCPWSASHVPVPLWHSGEHGSATGRKNKAKMRRIAQLHTIQLVYIYPEAFALKR